MKSSSAARSSNTVAPWWRARAAVMSARRALWVGVGVNAQPQQFGVVEVHPGVFCQPPGGAQAGAGLLGVRRWSPAVGSRQRARGRGVDALQ